MKARVDFRMVCAVSAVFASLASAPSGAAQSSINNGFQSGAPQAGGVLQKFSLLTPSSLPHDFAGVLQNMGGRMTGAANASVTLAGTLTDANGTRPANITVQAPGLLRFQDNGSRFLSFNGSQFQGKNTSGGAADQRIEESLLAQFPDMLLLQIALGGSLRRLPGHFRSDSGSYWRMYAFSPAPLAGLTAGGPLQQSFFIAIDEQSWLIAETRVVINAGGGQPQVTQTKYSNWFQQGGQRFPGSIVRLENGQQVLSFQTQSGSTGAAAPASAFLP